MSEAPPQPAAHPADAPRDGAASRGVTSTDAARRFDLSVVVTVFSETFSLAETLARLVRADRGMIREILLVVSPRSSPACFETCRRLAAEDPRVSVHVQQHNPGVGHAIREGMALAGGTHVALLSADLETEPEAVDRMMRKIEDTGCDAVIGNRWLPGGGFQNYDRKKLVLNWLFQRLFRLLYLTRLGDLTYGFKVLSAEVCRGLTWEGVFHEIYIETTVKPLRAGYRVEQVPTVWIGRREGVSQNTFARNFRYVWMALRVWARGPGPKPGPRPRKPVAAEGPAAT